MATASDPSIRAHNAPSQARIACATTLDEVDALETAWRDLAEEVGHPLADFAWTRACLAGFATTAACHIITAAQADRLVAIAPLVKKRVRGVSRLCLAGVGEVHEPMDLVATDPRALDRLIRRLALAGTPLLFERMPAESASLKCLRRAYRGRAVVIERPQASCPFIELDETWLEPEQHLNAGRRSDLRRARRKAEQSGPVTTEIRTPELDELPELLDLCFEVEARSWKGQSGTALAHDIDRAIFYRQFAQAAAIEGTLRVCLLRIGDHVAAMQLALEAGEGFWLLKVGYDAQFAACSPGNLLVRDTIRYAVEAGLKRYEFLGRAEKWTAVWAATERPYVSLRVYPLGVRGLAALTIDGLATGWRKWTESRNAKSVGAADSPEAIAPTRTAPVRNRFSIALRRQSARCLSPLIDRVATAFIAGPRLDDAVRVAEKFSRGGASVGFGYWDSQGEPPRKIADEYLAAVAAVAGGLRPYVAIKVPSLGFCPKLVGEIVELAARLKVRVHFDALTPDSAERSRRLFEDFARQGAELSYTLPCRWKRSIDDAQWAVERGIAVRLVKGQFAEADETSVDLRANYLRIVDTLAGRARHVLLASHDAPLVSEAARRLQARGTLCEQELLYGLPMTQSLAAAKRLNLPLSVYMPYGRAYLPYALSQLRKNPRLACWLASDWLLPR